ncbi:DUF2868 domain-containing protein [Caldimonas brevitalea]|uniref:Integral membrane protein n=1 Tax=Caldimonas brevitalea TaxID=413882 RepID=A0A0G3BJT9_9BURK|nr:DUF2868 domain-containing protein [Caldimonas brevitalea]AKJ29734.1 integral membrane protein [Caldimonas brevitalea]
MTESDASQLLLIRAHEDPLTPPWSEADALWASREARRLEGEAAPPERVLVRRGALAVERLGERSAQVPAALHAVRPSPLWTAAALGLALLVGLAGNAIGPSQRINILAPPLLALLVWNLLVYVGLVWATLRRGAKQGGPLRLAVASLAGWVGPMARWLHRAGVPPPLRRYAEAWWHASRPLQAARLAAVLHAAAAMVAIGAVSGLYLRGLAFEYRAAWDSTFLAPEAVEGLLRLVLTPAARLGDIELPAAAELAELRASSGGGENAARWIHLYAITLACAVAVPRLLLAGWAALRARGLARRFPLSLDDRYFSRLVGVVGRGETVAARVFPYSYQVGPALLGPLQQHLREALGGEVVLTLAPSVPLGGEDEPARWQAGTAGDGVTIALFPLTATPERENHGAFVQALAGRGGGSRQVVVVVDESGFRQRFPTDTKRLEQRRAAWQSVLAETGHEGLFVDLAAQPLEEPTP